MHNLISHLVPRRHLLRTGAAGIALAALVSRHEEVVG